MTVETPLLTAFAATAGAVLIAVIGLIASVHYRLGKLEQAQDDMAANQKKEGAEIRELVTRENAHTREMMAEGDARNRELIVQTREMLVEGDAHTREILVEGDAHTRELIVNTRELIMQEIAALRERFDAQHAETMSAIQRLTDAFLSHSHDVDGTIRFSIPPPAPAPPGQQPRADDQT